MIWSQKLLTVEQLESILQTHAPHTWLSTAEQQRFASFSAKESALAWLGGRWCAKQLLRSKLDVPDSELFRIHIQSKDRCEQSIRPWVFLDGRMQSENLSLSHTPQLSAAVLLNVEEQEVGIDISETSRDLSDVKNFWFTEQELSWCDAGITPQLIWALKETLYKATNQGEAFRPRQFDVSDWLSQQECFQLDRRRENLLTVRSRLTLASSWFCGLLVTTVAFAKPARDRFPSASKPNSFAQALAC